MRFLRVLGWMLAVALLLNAMMAAIAYGDKPVDWLSTGALFLTAILLLTSPRIRRAFS